MQFSDFKSIDDVTKRSQLEVLLKYISVDGQGNFEVLPIRCPGLGRKENVLTMENGDPACAYGKSICPYFSGANFEFESSIKRIFCEVPQ